MVPPAGREVRASVARKRMSPFQGTVTARGCFNISWTSLKAWESGGVQAMFSLSDLAEGIWRSSSLGAETSLEPG